ncbi:hypothetical protein FCULG_00003244, partial [Fusarium culmorum]
SSRFITSSIRAAPRQHAIAITAAKFTRSNRHQSTMSSDQQIIFTKNAPAGNAWPLRMLKLPLTDRNKHSSNFKTVSSHQDPHMIYCSGQIPLTPEGELVQGITEQTRQACKNVQAVVEEAGSSLSKVVKTTVFISDMSYFAVSTARMPLLFRLLINYSPKNVDVEVEVIALP